MAVVIQINGNAPKNSDNDPRGTSTRSFTLTGEPDLFPAVSVPATITTPVGREIRFHNPVALRSHVPPVGVAVTGPRRERRRQPVSLWQPSTY